MTKRCTTQLHLKFHLQINRTETDQGWKSNTWLLCSLALHENLHLCSWWDAARDYPRCHRERWGSVSARKPDTGVERFRENM